MSSLKIIALVAVTLSGVAVSADHVEKALGYLPYVILSILTTCFCIFHREKASLFNKNRILKICFDFFFLTFFFF